MQRRILIADDHPLVREALRMALRARFPDLIVEEAVSIEPAEQLIATHHDIALVLLDYQLPDSQGFSGFFRLQHALGTVPVAIISAYDDDRIVGAARAVGAAGFISKSQGLEEIAAGVEQLLRGQTVFPQERAISADIREMSVRFDTLSSAQKRVMAALVRGDLNKQIAHDLDLSEATIKAHLTAIFRKLGVPNRLQAILAVKPLLAPEMQG